MFVVNNLLSQSSRISLGTLDENDSSDFSVADISGDVLSTVPESRASIFAASSSVLLNKSAQALASLLPPDFVVVADDEPELLDEPPQAEPTSTKPAIKNAENAQRFFFDRITFSPMDFVTNRT